LQNEKESNPIKISFCDGAIAGGRLEFRPPVESSDLDEKVLTTTPVRDTDSLVIWVES
jgi:hypothetical protein